MELNDIVNNIAKKMNTSNKDYNFDLSKFYKHEGYSTSIVDKEGLNEYLKTLPFSSDIIEQLTTSKYGIFPGSFEDLIEDIAKNRSDEFKNISSIKITAFGKTFAEAITVSNNRLSTLGIFCDEHLGNGIRTNHDEILYRDDSSLTYVIKDNHKHRLVISFDTISDYENIHEIASGNKILAPLKLADCKLYSDIQVSCDNDIIEVHGDVVVESSTPIHVICSDVSTVTIIGDGTLTLDSEYMQPCIGPMTNTGMSYGRWSPSTLREKPSKIVIDGVHVVCKSKVKDFSLGAYNYEFVPEIVCLNGGSIDCPEITGERLLVRVATPPAGSTKISTAAEYAIRKTGMTNDDLMSEELKAIKSYLPESLGDYIKYDTKIEEAKKVATLYSKNLPDVLTDKLSCIFDCSATFIAEAVVYLNLPKEFAGMSEMFYESEKARFFDKFSKNNDYLFSGKNIDIMFAVLMDYMIQLCEADDLLNEIIYNLIPAYSYHFDRDLSHKQNAIIFRDTTLEKCTKEIAGKCFESIDFVKVREHFNYLEWYV